MTKSTTRPLAFSDFPEVIKNILDRANTIQSELAWEQASRMNYHLWPLLFEESLRSKLPSCVMAI